MEISMTALSEMFAMAFLLGAGFGALYDILRITRVMLGVSYGISSKSTDFFYSRTYPLIGKIEKRESKAKQNILNIIIAIEDVLFCTVIGAVFCVFLYYTNDGIFRLGALIAVFIGFFIYYRTIGTIILYFAEIISIFLKILTNLF